jgi:hypothetical protein
MAERTGLEPATSTVTVWRSNQLNYRSTMFFVISWIGVLTRAKGSPSGLNYRSTILRRYSKGWLVFCKHQIKPKLPIYSKKHLMIY